MKKETKLPKCIKAKDKRTGAIHEFCARPNRDRGDIVITDDYRSGHETMSNLREVMDYSKENFRPKDYRRILKMTAKAFRLANKSLKERAGGLGYSKFSLWGSKKDSSSI